MPRYELNRLGDVEFENLLQALIKEIIGDGTITFGAGPDARLFQDRDGLSWVSSRDDAI